MKAAGTWLLCLLLLGLALRGAASRAHQHSMEIRSEYPNPPPPPGVRGGPGHFLSWGVLANRPRAGGLASCFPDPSPSWPRHLLPRVPAQHTREGHSSPQG